MGALGAHARIGVPLASLVIVMVVVGVMAMTVMLAMPGMVGVVGVVACIHHRPAQGGVMMMVPMVMPRADHHRAVPGAEQRVQQHAKGDQDGRSAFHQSRL